MRRDGTPSSGRLAPRSERTQGRGPPPRAQRHFRRRGGGGELVALSRRRPPARIGCGARPGLNIGRVRRGAGLAAAWTPTQPERPPAPPGPPPPLRRHLPSAHPCPRGVQGVSSRPCGGCAAARDARGCHLRRLPPWGARPSLGCACGARRRRRRRPERLSGRAAQCDTCAARRRRGAAATTSRGSRSPQARRRGRLRGALSRWDAMTARGWARPAQGRRRAPALNRRCADCFGLFPGRRWAS